MPDFDDLYDETLIEIAQYNPEFRYLLDDENKQIVEEQLGDVRIMLYEWENDMLTHKAVDIIILALVECDDDVVYRIMNRLGFNNNRFNSIVCYKAARYGRLEVISYLIENGFDDWKFISFCAAYIGDRDLLNDVIKMGANDWKNISYGAAQGGHTDIVNDVIRGRLDGMTEGVRKYKAIAAYAALGGHRDLVNDMLRRVVLSKRALTKVAKFAVGNGHRDIMIDMIEKEDHRGRRYLGSIEYSEIAAYAIDHNYPDIMYELLTGFVDRNGNIIRARNYKRIAASAAKLGRRDLVLDLIARESSELSKNDWVLLAINAAKGGHSNLMYYFVSHCEPTIDDWTNIAEGAAIGGYKEIVLDIHNKGVDVSSLDFGKHEDARIYFS